MKFKIVSFGKKMENLKTAIDQKVIGSEHSSFLSKLNKGEVMDCGREIVAVVS